MSRALFESVVTRLALQPELHARFVNTLSFMEYIGARKILKSQPAETISARLLAHANEEIRHAQVFKRIALKMSGDQLSTYAVEHLLCGPEAESYLQSIDRGVAQALEEAGRTSPWENYLLTTLLIEERANVIYPYYDGILSELGFPGALRAIVREEDAHLAEMRSELEARPAFPTSLLDRLRADEEAQFSAWFEVLHTFWG